MNLISFRESETRQNKMCLRSTNDIRILWQFNLLMSPNNELESEIGT